MHSGMSTVVGFAMLAACIATGAQGHVAGAVYPIYEIPTNDGGGLMEIWRHDGVLLPYADGAWHEPESVSAVRQDSWGRIKASFR